MKVLSDPGVGRFRGPSGAKNSKKSIFSFELGRAEGAPKAGRHGESGYWGPCGFRPRPLFPCASPFLVTPLRFTFRVKVTA